MLPMYTCAQCDDAMVLGGGGTLLCTTCRSSQVFSIRDSVALLGLRTKGYNHRQGAVIGSVPQYRDNRYGVLLVGETEPIAVRPVNMHSIYTSIFSPPVYRERPREQEGGGVPGTANVAVFEPQDVPMEGARYESSAASVVSSAGEVDGTENKTREAAGTDGQADQSWLPQQPQSYAEQLERECTSCGWCSGTPGQPCKRWACAGRVPFCIKCNVGVKEAAAADAKRPYCTDEICFGRSGCQQGWGGQMICQEDARPALSGYKYNLKARSALRRFMKGIFRYRPYAKLPPANEDNWGSWNDEIVPFEGESTVPWNPTVDYAAEYRHLDWCRRSCDLECNPNGRERDFAPYLHDDFCTGGCGNRCSEQRSESAMSALGAGAPPAESGGWGTAASSSNSGGWGTAASSNNSDGWGTVAPGDNVGGWGRSGDEAQNADGWGTSAGSTQNVGGWGSAGGEARNSGDCSGTPVSRDRPQERQRLLGLRKRLLRLHRLAKGGVHRMLKC